MSDEGKDREPLTLKRWSARKREMTQRPTAQQTDVPSPPIRLQNAPGPSESAPAAAPSQPCEPEPLPHIDSLTFDSDFTRFMQHDVDESLKRSALKKLFSDPRFNVMDGLDVYIDDYSKPDPIEPDLVKKLAHARYIFAPPATRINEAGFVEDVPEEPQTASPPAAASAAEAARIESLESTPVDSDVAVQLELPLAPSETA